MNGEEGAPGCTCVDGGTYLLYRIVITNPVSGRFLKLLCMLFWGKCKCGQGCEALIPPTTHN